MPQNAGKASRRQFSFYLLLTCSLFLLGACTSPLSRFNPPPASSYTQAQLPSYQGIRSWGDEPNPQIDEAIPRLANLVRNTPSIRKRIDLLALSGGAEDGAYGAGFLNGWSQRGDRPEFLMVTGVSTGALMAPFVFLGSDYDATIKRLFTETSTRDVVEVSPASLLSGLAIGNASPLRRIIREVVNHDLVQKIARESRRGRILQIGTTNLLAQRPVIWDLGRIAESGNPDAAQLIGDIMIASASIPGLLPPVILDVNIGNQTYQELHVDGGVTNQIFLYPRAIRASVIERRLGVHPKKYLWLIRNTRISPEYKALTPGIDKIAIRSIETLIKYQGRGDLINIFSIARRDGFQVKLTSMPDSFRHPKNNLFDSAYMSALYQKGVETALSGNGWTSNAEEALSGQR